MEINNTTGMTNFSFVILLTPSAEKYPKAKCPKGSM
jgi:hypothetical protein